MTAGRSRVQDDSQPYRRSKATDTSVSKTRADSLKDLGVEAVTAGCSRIRVAKAKKGSRSLAQKTQFMPRGRVHFDVVMAGPRRFQNK